MDIEQYFDLFNDNDPADIFEETCDFFSQKLSEEAFEDYDLGEAVLIICEGLEDAKEFDKLFRFIKILKDKQPRLLKEAFPYINDFLVAYYCFNQDSSKVKRAFSNFIQNPDQNYDKYLSSFKQLLNYQYIDLLDKAVTKNFETFYHDEDLMPDALYELSIFKLFHTIEQFYRSNKWNEDQLIELMEPLDLEIDNFFFSSIREGLFESLPEAEKLAASFPEDTPKVMVRIEGYFLKYMAAKGFSFPLSGYLWDLVIPYWRENEDVNKSLNPDEFFRIQKQSFENFLAGLLGNIFNVTYPDMIGALWGSVYIYDFLRNTGLISDKTYNSFLEIARTMKGKTIAHLISHLWKLDFVHCWEKPEGVPEKEFEEETKIFQKSLNIKIGEDIDLEEKFGEELSEIGELAEIIRQEAKAKKEDEQAFNLQKNDMDPLFNLDEVPLETENERGVMISNGEKPYRTEKKPGRNDPCPCGSGKKYKKCCGKINSSTNL